VHLQRALLLFAIVLGLAAVAASLSRTDRGRSSPAPAPDTTPAETATTPAPGPDPGSELLRFTEGGKPEVRDLAVGRAATVLVAVKRPGEAEIEGLGEPSAAEPATPASFDVFQTRPGSFRVVFTPAAGGRREGVGTLRVRAAKR
jgi:hypothetical protein